MRRSAAQTCGSLSQGGGLGEEGSRQRVKTGAAEEGPVAVHETPHKTFLFYCAL